MQSELKAAGKDKKEQERFSPTENDSMKIKKVEVFKNNANAFTIERRRSPAAKFSGSNTG